MPKRKREVVSSQLKENLINENRLSGLFIYIREKFNIENVIKYFPQYHNLYDVCRLKTYVCEKK